MSEARPYSLESWCSWCGEFSRHTLFDKHGTGRSTFMCASCKLLTAQCRYCDSMARALIDDCGQAGREHQGARIWQSELCAEHDGSIPNFTKATARILELGEFRHLMRPRKKNLYGLGGRAVVGTGDSFVRAVDSYLTVPGIAVALGGTSSAASNGTPQGEALASASLTQVGSRGQGVVAAVSAALGGKTGYGLANAYLKEMPDYHFTLKRSTSNDRGHRVVMVNGLLSEGDLDAHDWCDGLLEHYRDASLWYLNWEAKKLRKLGSMLVESGRGVRSSGLLLGGEGRAANPWRTALLNAAKAGALLAEAITRTEGRTFTLMGHSLGARVIFFALLALASKGKGTYVRDAVMMGGAVDNDSELDWAAAAGATSARIYNCYSEQDGVLKWLWREADAGLSTPAGLLPVPNAGKRIINCSFSDLVGGHNEWKANLGTVLDRLELGRVKANGPKMSAS